MSKLCGHCGNSIPATIEVNGLVKKTVYTRNTCYVCRPFGNGANKRTPIKFIKGIPNGHRRCTKCEQARPVTDFYVHSPKTGYRDSTCRFCHVLEQKTKRDERKTEAIAYKGGECVVCGYSKCPASLHFHHLDPSEKELQISKTSMKWERIQEELDKCVLLCSNCHGEVHAGMTKLPPSFESGSLIDEREA